MMMAAGGLPMAEDGVLLPEGKELRERRRRGEERREREKGKELQDGLRGKTTSNQSIPPRGVGRRHGAVLIQECVSYSGNGEAIPVSLFSLFLLFSSIFFLSFFFFFFFFFCRHVIADS